MKCEDCGRFLRFNKNPEFGVCGETINDGNEVRVVDEDTDCFIVFAYPQGIESEEEDSGKTTINHKCNNL